MKLCILGSTGSIGTQTLQIVEKFPEKYSVLALAAGKNIGLLSEQIEKFRPRFVSVANPGLVSELKSKHPGIEFVSGDEGLLEIVDTDYDICVVGIVGFAALAPTVRAIQRGKKIALANKESLVTAGGLLKKEIKKSGSLCIPVDSEHNALFQLLSAYPRESIESIVLTASGGPLLKRPELPLSEVTPEIAVKHPNWSMGPKISVDSATLMNKGLELIEAHVLFDFPEEKIEVWVHPQSIVHGAVWFKDHSCIAQMNKPDMRCSIGHALAYPERLPRVIPKMSFKDMARLEFLEPDTQRFPALRLAREALRAGPSFPIVLNASNEIAVHHFLQNQLGFEQITQVVAEVMEKHRGENIDSVEQVFRIDAEARSQAASSVVAAQSLY